MAYFEAVKDKSKVMYVIQGERGGVVPQALRGKYTKKQFADNAIKSYEEAQNASKESDGKRSGRGSGAASKKELSGS